ncbi:MAG: L-seryl-tRNA(Sec) selenium transferase [Gemmatimonadetes bacterium]|nr:L-seryl-tRNA(Sec) selenium transferase [Gemmatimonadota bacterium]NNM07094.1 L-seryl-tRNA(Sec) selenium transferase [Gemmatimonadota bacterium]
MTDPRRNLPGVDVLLASEAFRPVLADYPRGRVVAAVRDALVLARGEIGALGEAAVPADDAEWARRVGDLLSVRDLPSLRGVINATGVILHTNLGRAPLSQAARAAMVGAGRGYSNLEFDLDKGERGSRYVHCVDLLKELTGAQDALVVNNNAAAVVLALNSMAAGREVLVSRGELVEIGGGFRIPDMLSRSGAVLKEVGTTNRTRLEDYREAAEGGSVGAILKVHRSNFRISGFTEEVKISDLAALADELGLFLFYDLGSGLLADPGKLGLPPEPRAHESLLAGVHAVAISGDKLLGGPQAGIILGDGEVVGAMRKNPLCRAFRVDKVTLAGLEATLRHYLDEDEALREIPALRMLSAPLDDLAVRAQRLCQELVEGVAKARVAEGSGVVGGGTCPGVDLPTWTVRLRPIDASPRALAKELRSLPRPVVVRVEDEEVVIDMRTVEPDEDAFLLAALNQASEACG